MEEILTQEEARAWALARRGKEKNNGGPVQGLLLPESFSESPKVDPSVWHQEPVTDTFTCDSEEITGLCPILKVKPVVLVPEKLYRICKHLAENNDREWFAYLVGKHDEATGEAVVEEIWFPPQIGTGGHCEPMAERVKFREGTIGSIHSHHSMGAFFSLTDRAHMNWPVELVINSKGEMVAAVRTKYECGKIARLDCPVKLLVDQLEFAGYKSELEKALKEGDKKLQKEVRRTKQTQGGSFYNGWGGMFGGRTL